MILLHNEGKESAYQELIFMFHRKIEATLNQYCENMDDNILIITGARQIGKSFIIRETAKKFRNYVEINLQDDFDGEKIFSQIKSIKDFYFAVTSLYGDKMNDV